MAAVAWIVLLAPADTEAAPAARPQLVYPDRIDASGPLREMPVLPDQAGRKTLPRKDLANRIESPVPPAAVDPALNQSPAPAVGTTFLNFEGVNNRNGVLPPDTNGDIGPGHYVQWVNLSLQVWSIDRTNRTATSVYGPVNGNTIWSGFGGPCSTTNNGDPIVLYDQAADRWMISQFALPNYPNGPFYQCIAVSQTPDPTAGWYRYQFTVSQNKMNDYPHFGVWGDGYYMSVNQFNAGSLTWGGQGVAVFERDQMLQGLAARMVYFDLHPVDANLGGMQPADLDGAAAPPTNAPNVFAAFDDDAWGYSQDQVQLWNFHVDWTTPADSTFVKVGSLETAAFDSNLCAYARSCVPQPATTAKLDTISDRLMYRLQYRNFGTYETLVGNHTVDVDGADRAGVRWYELRKSGEGSWNIYQQGTFSPDDTDRWMGSVAMNGAGQIALGYSIASSSIHPSIRYTGRLPTDAAGTMTQGETTIVDGSGSQTSSASRWGDYSSMSVDPVDDCTFWYTTEYVQTTGSAPWRTRIASFRFPGCGSTSDNPPNVSITSPASGAAVAGVVAVSADANDDNGVDQVEFAVDGTVIATDTDGTDGWSASWDTSTIADGSWTVTATARDTIGQTGSDTHQVTVANSGVAVPDVVGLTQSAATAAITGSGLVVGTVALQSSAIAPAGEVISQDPLAETVVAVGTSVNLVVSSGPASASAEVAPASLAFGSQPLNLASPGKTVTITNTGAVVLPVNSITLTGANPGQFSRTTNCPSQLPVAGSCAVTVAFKPTSTGTKSANLAISLGGGAGNKTVALSGTGVRSTFSLSPTSLSFGRVARNTTSAAKAVTVTNTGTVVLPITSITLAGANPGQFARINNCPAQVSVGGKCTISVTFKPTSTGSKSASLRVTPGGGASVKTVALSGTGF